MKLFTVVNFLLVIPFFTYVVSAQDRRGERSNHIINNTADSLVLDQLVKANLAFGNMYLVSFHYKFSGREQVFIRGFGPAPAEGSFKYFTTDSKLDILDSVGGKLIASKEFTDALITMSTDMVDVPTDADFPASFIRCTITKPEQFEANVLGLLNRYFSKGYVISGSEKRSTIITMYTSLGKLPANLFGELAVKIVHPIADEQVDVYYSVRERRSRTDWRAVESKAVEDAAATFLEDFIKQLERN